MARDLCMTDVGVVYSEFGVVTSQFAVQKAYCCLIE
jgi:hypothetical protein